MTTAALVGVFAAFGVHYARANAVFDVQGGQQQYVSVAEYIGQRLPADAVLLSMQHSGSVRYYSGRLTVRYDWIPPAELDSVLEDLRRMGYHPYIVMYDWEEPSFRSKFREHSPIGALDWPPIAISKVPTAIRIYDPADQPRRDPPAERTVDVIP